MGTTEKQQEEIQEVRDLWSRTRRVTVTAMEEILYQIHPVLDHGFVRVCDYMGDDAAVVQAARLSYGKGTTKLSSDRGLIRYLTRNWHTTPTEMCEIKLHCKMPIFVARQWIRHRTASVNEVSSRYSILDKEFYIPHTDNLAQQSKKNRQGRAELIEGEEAQQVLALLKHDAANAYTSYEKLLKDHDLSRELARMNLPVSIYTQWYWKIDLKNLFHFLGLRMDGHAQFEIRAYADVIGNIVKQWMPHSWEAFEDYHPKRNAVLITRPEQRFIQLALAIKAHTPDYNEVRDVDGQAWAAALKACGLTLREFGELEAKLPALGLDQQFDLNSFASVGEDVVQRELARLRTQWTEEDG